MHRFKVRAVDGGGRYCEADIHIAVEDVNDNPPQFSSDPYSITVFENTETGTYMAKLQANDVDTGEEIFNSQCTIFPQPCASTGNSLLFKDIYFVAGAVTPPPNRFSLHILKY